MATSSLRNRQMYMQIGAILIAIGSLFYLTQNCGQVNRSRLSDIATRDSLKTGLFSPQATIDLVQPAVGQKMAPEALAARAGVQLQRENPFDTFSVVMAHDGEQILMLEKVGMYPQPVVSVDQTGRVYVWILQVFANTATRAQGTAYVKVPAGSPPAIYVSEDGNESNLYFMRHPTATTGRGSPAIVSMLNHAQTANGLIVYKAGNVLFEAKSNTPVLTYIRIAEKVWRVKGVYADRNVRNGTVFWTNDFRTYYSMTPGASEVVEWRTQDDNSFDIAGRRAPGSVQAPKVALAATEEGQRVLDSGVQRTSALGYDELAPGPRVIPVYQGRTTLPVSQRSKRLAKSGGPGGTTGFADPTARYSDRKTAKGGYYAAPGQVAQSQVGGTFQLMNQNNGYYMNVRTLKSDPISINKGSLNAFFSGSNEYVGRDETYEILTNDGSPTGQYIRQQWYPSMGINSAYSTQRHVSLNELDAELARSQEGRAETLRTLHERNAQLQQRSEAALSAAADAEKGFIKAIEAAPGNIAVGTLKDTFKVNGLGNKVAVDVAAEAGKQTLGATSTAITNYAFGDTGVSALSQFDATKIVTSGVTSLVKNGGLKDAGREAGQEFAAYQASNLGASVLSVTESGALGAAVAGTGLTKLGDGFVVRPLVSGKGPDVAVEGFKTGIDVTKDFYVSTLGRVAPGSALAANTLAEEGKLLVQGAGALNTARGAVVTVNQQAAVLSQIANETVGRGQGEINGLRGQLAQRREEIQRTNSGFNGDFGDFAGGSSSDGDFGPDEGNEPDVGGGDFGGGDTDTGGGDF